VKRAKFIQPRPRRKGKGGQSKRGKRGKRKGSVDMGEVIDKLYLELSEVAKTRTRREIVSRAVLLLVRDYMQRISIAGHNNDYDWHDDPLELMKLEKDALRRINQALVIYVNE
jgi:hypothetical protein